MDFIFFGTADFGLPALQSLIDAGHTAKAVVTNPPKPAGRGLKLRKSPVALYCEEHNIAPVLTPESIKSESFIQQLHEIDAEVYVVVAFSILPQSVFSIPAQGTFNIHAALLPLFRGPAPIHRAIEQGATETGVTVFRIDKGVDTGTILLQKSLQISPNETTPELYERLSMLGSEAIVSAFETLSSGTAAYTAQDHSLATHAPLLKKSESTINWQEDATTISNKIRAFKPFPGTATQFNGKKLDIIEAIATTHDQKGTVGEVIQADKGGIFIACGSGVLELKKVKPAGKKAISARDFLNGSKIEKGIILG